MLVSMTYVCFKRIKLPHDIIKGMKYLMLLGTISSEG